MNDKQNLRLLGLGLDTILWKRIAHQLTRMFLDDEIDLEFNLVKYKWSNFKTKCLENMAGFSPDFIFTSFELFKGIEEMESFFQSYQPAELVEYPSLILIDHKPHRFIKQYLKFHSYSEIHFRQFPRLRIGNPDLITDNSLLSSPLEIQPLPEIFFKEKKDVFLDRDKLVGFATWSDIATVFWKEKHYTPFQFCEFFDKTYQNEVSTKHSKGILFDCGRSYISPGFLLRDIVKLETSSLPIEHLISYQQVKSRHPELEALSYKLLETAKYRCSLRFNENYLGDQGALKAHAPITISSDSILICSVFNQLMLKDGYLKTVIADQADDSADRFLISLHTEPVEKTPFTFSIILDKQVPDIEGLEDPRLSGQLTEVELEDIADSVMLQKRINQVNARLQKLKDQLKVLSSSKAESDKKRYMDMISRNKMEIIKNLLEVSEIWDEHSCDVSVTRQENVLILYDDENQAEMIDEQLENNNRKVFLDISKRMVDLESLVGLNTGPLEHFLHDGVIICCMTTKAVLLRRFQQFDQELSQKKYPPLEQAISNLESEISKCIERSQRLQLLDYSSYLSELYLENSDSLSVAIQNYFKEVEKTRYRIKNNGAVFVIGDDEENCNRIITAIGNSCNEINDISFKQIFTELNLFHDDLSDSDKQVDVDKSENDLIGFNVKELSRYYKTIAAEIGLRDVSIFFLAGNPQINQLLIEFLRQKGSKYVNTPIVLLASGIFNYQLMKELSQDGVKVLYQDQFRRYNPEALTQTFKILFSAY